LALLENLLEPLRQTNKTVRIVCEPGTRIVADAGILVAEVTTIEQRDKITWVGLNAGYNVNCYKAYYDVPLTIMLANCPSVPEQELKKYHIAGNINESRDMFAIDEKLPPLKEDDLLSFFPCGAYGSSMMSNHCMRGDAEVREVLVPLRRVCVTLEV